MLIIGGGVGEIVVCWTVSGSGSYELTSSVSRDENKKTKLQGCKLFFF